MIVIHKTCAMLLAIRVYLAKCSSNTTTLCFIQLYNPTNMLNNNCIFQLNLHFIQIHIRFSLHFFSLNSLCYDKASSVEFSVVPYAQSQNGNHSLNVVRLFYTQKEWSSENDCYSKEEKRLHEKRANLRAHTHLLAYNNM